MLDTHQKALAINLDPRKYGTFAEIGAGQEVVRWFFTVGGAAGTVVKSISAYDMTVSNILYGMASRYVSRERLESMLQREWDELVTRLAAKRGAETEFFVFADTVAARSFRSTHDCHGWMGVRFQPRPHSEASQIIIHVRMLDKDAVAQQEALGVVGVNLLYAALSEEYSTPEAKLRSLLDSLSARRLEIDMVHMSGPHFAGVDHRLLSLYLVEWGLSEAAMFDPDGTVLQPSEVLYKRPVLVERGSFRPVTHVNVDMLDCAREQFTRECAAASRTDGPEPVLLAELTMNKLLHRGAGSNGAEKGSNGSGEEAPPTIDYQDFLARADLLEATGAMVLVSNFFEYYRLAAYLGRLTRESIRLVMGVPSLREVLDEKYYGELDGGILEALGRLFKSDLKLYVYPLLDRASGDIIPADAVPMLPHLEHLYRYLVENERIVPLPGYKPEYLPIFSREVLARIDDGDGEWEKLVPAAVAEIIKARGYFGCPAPASL